MTNKQRIEWANAIDNMLGPTDTANQLRSRTRRKEKDEARKRNEPENNWRYEYWLWKSITTGI